MDIYIYRCACLCGRVWVCVRAPAGRFGRQKRRSGPISVIGGGTTGLGELAGMRASGAILRSCCCNAHIRAMRNMEGVTCEMQRESRDAAVMCNVRQSLQPATTIRNARAVRRATRPRSMQPQYMQHATRYMYRATRRMQRATTARNMQHATHTI